MRQVAFPGPFQHHEVVVDGHLVPFLTARPRGDQCVDVVLDRRFSLSMTDAEARRFVPFLADAIAVAGGYPSHPRH
jgi:hypothetical protein